MRFINSIAAAIALTLVTTAARAGSVFDGWMEYESPIAMVLHVGARLVGKMFS